MTIISQCIEEASNKENQVPKPDPTNPTTTTTTSVTADYDFVNELNDTKDLAMPQHRSGRKTAKTNTKTQTKTVQVAEESDYDFAFEFQVIHGKLINLLIILPLPLALSQCKKKTIPKLNII